MLNTVNLMGRITAPLELKQTQSGKSVLSFTVAVDRGITDENGNRETDFIDLVAWGKTAEFINNYFDKGRMICIEGRLQKRSYDTQDGQKRYVTEVIVRQVHFTGEKKDDTSTNNYEPDPQNFSMSDFQEINPDDDLPF